MKQILRLLKSFGMFIFTGAAIYAVLMIVIRLKMTALGYDFEEAKSTERNLREEQGVLRAVISQKMGAVQFKQKGRLEGFQEPSPGQVIIIP